MPGTTGAGARASFSVKVVPFPTTLSTRMRPLWAFDDLAAKSQAEAGSTLALLVGLFGRVERLEDLAELVRGNAAARVAKRDFGHAALIVGVDGKIERSAVLHRLPRVDDQVEQDLLNLVRIDEGEGAADKVGLQTHAVHLQVFLDQHQHVVDDGHQIGELPPLALRRAYESMPVVIFDARWPAVRILSNAFSRVPTSLCRRPILA